MGDVPKVKVELSAEDGYRFSYTSKSHFSLSGCNAEFKKATISDGGNYIEVYAELKRIGGKLEGASELEWEGTTAYWGEIEGAKSYDVKLMRDEKTVTTVETTGTSYNFAGYFNREGDYTFRVRALPVITARRESGRKIPIPSISTRKIWEDIPAPAAGCRIRTDGGMDMIPGDIPHPAGNRLTEHGITLTAQAIC